MLSGRADEIIKIGRVAAGRPALENQATVPRDTEMEKHSREVRCRDSPIRQARLTKPTHKIKVITAKVGTELGLKQSTHFKAKEASYRSKKIRDRSTKGDQAEHQEI